MTARLLLVFFLFFFSSGALSGQIINLNGYGQTEIGKWTWQEGGVEFKSGKQVQGYIKYASEETSDVLQTRINDTLFVHDARQVRLFWVFDDHVDIMRTFYALPYLQDENKVEFRFFEALVEGEHMLALHKIEYKLGPKAVGYRTVMKGGKEMRIEAVPHFGDSPYKALQLTEELIIEQRPITYETILLITPTTYLKAYNLPTSTIQSRHKLLRRPQKKMLLQMMQDHEAEVKAFIALKQLNLAKREDVLLVVQHYNEIKSRSAKQIE